MKKVYAAVCVAVVLLASPTVAQDRPPSAAQLAASVDTFYDHVSSLKQRFWLTQSTRMTSHLSRSWGEMRVLKPGKLRLDFDVDARSASSGERMILDGTRFSHYAPGSAGMPGTLDEVSASDASLAAPLGFLLGRGHLADAYTVRSVAPPADFRPTRGTPYTLVLTPKRPSMQASVILCIAYDRSLAASAVQRVILVSHDGSRTRYDFTGTPQVNGGVGPGDFHFTPPNGTEITRR